MKPVGPPIPERLALASEKRIRALDPRLSPLVVDLLHKCALRGWAVIVTDGRRDLAEQARIWLIGRDPQTGEVVDRAKVKTWAKPGESPHQYGLAVDVTFLGPDGRPRWVDSDPWAELGPLGESLGLEWGGRWETKPDRPHFQFAKWRAATRARGTA